jgi:hypothetical protein
MICQQCGLELSYSGQAHTCRAASAPPVRPEAGWELATWAAAGLAAQRGFGPALRNVAPRTSPTLTTLPGDWDAGES